MTAVSYSQPTPLTICQELSTHLLANQNLTTLEFLFPPSLPEKALEKLTGIGDAAHLKKLKYLFQAALFDRLVAGAETIFIATATTAAILYPVTSRKQRITQAIFTIAGLLLSKALFDLTRNSLYLPHSYNTMVVCAAETATGNTDWSDIETKMKEALEGQYTGK